jgi:hypothetical protein
MIENHRGIALCNSLPSVVLCELNMKIEVGKQKSEVGKQKSETGRQKIEI